MDDNYRSNIEHAIPRIGPLALGGLLILLGVMFLAAQIMGPIFRFDFVAVFWPFFVLVAGTSLVGFALLTDTPLSEPFSILGGMALMAGGLTFFQNLTGLWASWAYAWALVVPGGAGVGLVLYGLMHDRPEKVHDGTRLMRAALVIFALGFFFFELVLGIGGLGLGRFGWPLVLLAIGILMLARTLHTRSAGV
jgi:hypothetical protein